MRAQIRVSAAPANSPCVIEHSSTAQWVRAEFGCRLVSSCIYDEYPEANSEQTRCL